MKLPRALAFTTLLALGSASAWAQTNTISSVAIGTASTAGGTATGVATITPLIGTAGNQPGSVQNNLAGLQYVAGQIPLNGAPASIAFFGLTGATVAGGASNPATDFTSYGTLTSPTAVTTYSDLASKLTATSYSGLTFAAADLGFGANDFYMIHHNSGTDYFAQIVPGTGTSTLIRDLKPMSWTGPTAGGPANVGATGYFGLAWATGIGAAGAPYADQSIYYLRTDSGNSTQFGVMIPALTGASSDTLNLTTAVGAFGVGGYTTLAFSPTAIGTYGANQFYYLRQDTGPGGTGNTILGWLNPSLIAGTRTISDIANLGGVFNTLVFAPDATGPAGAWGSNQFYVAGAMPSGAESISFAAIPNHNVGDVFVITPTASSSLDITMTVVSGPATIATTGASGSTPSSTLVFTVTTTAPGLVTLRATQAGRTSPLPAYTANWLQQTFDVLGLPTITSATSAPATAGAAFTYDIVSTGSPTSYAANSLPAGLSLNAATGVISGTPAVAGTTDVLLTATNASGSANATLAITVAATGVAPIVANNSGTPAAATVGTPFSFTIPATGSPTSYTASPLPAGLSLNPATGAITGTPTAAGTTVVTLTATNAAGTGTTTLTIVTGAAGIAPVFAANPATPATATIGTPFGYTIPATDSPTSYTASPLPAGLSFNPATGAITGTPTAAGTTVVTITATNGAGTSTSTLTITIAPLLSSRIVNFSGRALSGTGSQTIIQGFVVSGNNKNLLIRGVGPTLGAVYGVPNALAAPVLTLYGTNGVIATNAAWQINTGTQPTGATLATIAAQVGAFPLQNGSLDSALFVTLNQGVYTTELLSQTGTPGIGLTEIYDADGTTNPGSRLINVSDRVIVANGNDILIAGFVIAGNGPDTVLIRGIGPTLTALGVTGALASPMITLFSSGSSTPLGSNAGWSTGATPAAQIVSISAQVGAFPLTAGSNDAALLVTLQPGAYSVLVTGVGGTTGVALLEIYDTE